MPARTLALADVFTGPLITLYGNPVKDIPFTDSNAEATRITAVGGVPHFARIRAFRLGPSSCTA